MAAVEPGRAGHGDAGGEKTVTRSVKSGERPDDAMKAEAGDEILGLTVEPLAAGIRPGDAVLEVDRGPGRCRCISSGAGEPPRP